MEPLWWIFSLRMARQSRFRPERRYTRKDIARCSKPQESVPINSRKRRLLGAWNRKYVRTSVKTFSGTQSLIRIRGPASARQPPIIRDSAYIHLSECTCNKMVAMQHKETTGVNFWKCCWSFILDEKWKREIKWRLWLLFNINLCDIQKLFLKCSVRRMLAVKRTSYKKVSNTLIISGKTLR